MSDYVAVFVTAPSNEEAERIATELLENKLVACANLVPRVTSLFWWEGKIDRAEEVLMVMKTRRARLEEVTEAVIAAHSYEVCEVVALPIEGGSAPYLQWIDDSVS
jgi:periplasmic divalent cation tolerance protein